VLEVTADCLLDQLSIARPVHDDRAGILELTERKERKPARSKMHRLSGKPWESLCFKSASRLSEKGRAGCLPAGNR